MSDRDWFRNETWSAEIDASFSKRLARSRSTSSKAQYLRIQASHLASAEDGDLGLVALRLLDRILAECPCPSQLEQTHLQRARCLTHLQRDDDAAAALREAVSAHASFPHLDANAWIAYGMFVVERRLASHYDSALAAVAAHIAERPDRANAPPYGACAIRALIYAERNDLEAARREAGAALEVRISPYSGEACHPYLSPSRAGDASIIARLRALAEAK